MSKISITETDLTTNLGNVADSTDVVFVPGFMGVNADGTQTEAECDTPYLCKTLSQFKTLFGSKPSTFKDGQTYPVHSYFKDGTITSTGNNGFTAFALPEASDPEEHPELIAIAEMTSGSADPGYVIASELLKAGLPVMYYAVSMDPEVEAPTVLAMYNAFITALFTEDPKSSCLTDNENQIKYITSGGYPIFEYAIVDSSGGQTVVYENELMHRMAAIAKERGEAIALIDHTNRRDRKLAATVPTTTYPTTKADDLSVYGAMNCRLSGHVIGFVANDDSATYASMYTPWAKYALTSSYGNTGAVGWFPGSYAYLIALAKSLKTNPSWYTVAGASRGLLTTMLEPLPNKKLTNAIANAYQEEVGGSENYSCINPITEIKPYGYCIWGNRTLRPFVDEAEGYATGFMNLRNMLCDIKKQAHVAAESLMFEQNNDVLWLNFKGMLTPLLDKMISGNGLEYYKVIKVEDESAKTKLSAQIKIKTIFAVEEFEIGIIISDDSVDVE